MKFGQWAPGVTGASPASIESAVLASLKRIDDHNARLHAWTFVDPDAALMLARRLDEAPIDAGAQPLVGLPTGLKDIFNVRGWPTEAGSPLLRGNIASRDSAIVKRLRDSGAVILGKLTTCEFASADPSPAVNPWDETRSPGGSSSGSAVAVAAGMIPFAIGSQTSGSGLRPAAYAGVVGYVPARGKVSTQGMIPHSASFDRVALMAASVPLAARVADVLTGDSVDRWTASSAPNPSAPPHLIVPHDKALDELATPSMRSAFDHVRELLCSAGAAIEDRELPEGWYQQVRSDFQTIALAELAEVHLDRYEHHLSQLGSALADRIGRGIATPAHQFVAAKRRVLRLRLAASPLVDGADAVLMLTTPAPAPSREVTGSPAYQLPWSYLGLPALTLPSGLLEGRWPVGIQLVGRRSDETRLWETAGWCEAQLGFAARPPDPRPAYVRGESAIAPERHHHRSR